MARKFSPNKEIITQLQLAPPPPKVVPAVAYPEEEGTYKGLRWYITSISILTMDEFKKGYLPFLYDCKQVIDMARERKEIRELAEKLTSGLDSNEKKAIAIHNWVYSNIKYEIKPEIVMPWELIKGESGDCKSFTCLTASLLGLAGIPCWLKLVELDGLEYLHIYPLGKLSWEVVDSVGRYVFKEVKPITAYILFEVDKTPDMPPKPLPQAGEVPIITEVTEQQFLKTASILATIAGMGLITYTVISELKKGGKK